MMRPREPFTLAGNSIDPGENRDLFLPVSETYTGDKIRMPVHIIHAKNEGPVVFVTAAIHGDEINGTGIIHDLLFGDSLDLRAGTLILVPVVNVFGFESNQRYMPDRRDLNRSFPGSMTGSLASRLANVLMQEIVARSDFGIDLHSAAAQRTNYPNIRGDFSRRAVLELAKAFGCTLLVDGKGPLGSFRREATRAGCPTIILEAGEPWKIEPSVLRIGVQGLRNVLIHLKLLDEKPSKPPFQVVVRKTTWLRASVAGILKFHVVPGAFVEEGQAIATNYSIFGQEQNTIVSHTHGIVLGMTTMPAVKPGEPVCHLAVISNRQLRTYQRAMLATKGDPHQRAQRHLATNLDVINIEQD